MDDAAKARLMKAGWHEDRRFATDGIAERLQRRGFTLFATARAFLERYGGLRAGDVITTGAWTGMHFVDPGAEIVARFPGIGEARVSFLR